MAERDLHHGLATPRLGGDTSVLIVEEDDGPRTVKQTGLGAQILSTMGLKQLILLTDSPLTRYLGLDAYDLQIVGTRPITGG